ncbi:MAG: thermonuclease family protein [Lautropia sp.]|nr:thermonuclease family protein [Lautropia sp.]
MIAVIRRLIAVIGVIFPVLLAAQELSCRVVGVADGDTLQCLAEGNRLLKVRLDQIDAPERGQDFAQVARRRLAALVAGRQVRLRAQGQDRYGRTVAAVRVDGLDVNAEMVRSGHAWAYRKHLKDPALLLLERAARDRGLGLWSQPDPVYPAEWRHGGVAGLVSASVWSADSAGGPSAGTHGGPDGAVPGAGPASRPDLLSSPAAVPQGGSSASANAATAAGGWRCGAKRFCRQMQSCEEARFYLNQCGVRRLDRDGDGRPCENLC